MAGGVGYLIEDETRDYESLAKLKSGLRRGNTVREWRFEFTQATGGVGAALEPEEKTGFTVTRLTTGNEAQVYIRAHTDSANYDDKTITLEAIDEAGKVLGPTATVFAATATDEVAVAGMTTFYRRRSMVSNVTPAAGHLFSIGDADHANDGSGTDAWGMIEEGNFDSRHSAYYCPTESAGGATMRGYLAKVDAWYSVAAEYCTVTVTFTPKDYPVETTMNWIISGLSPLHWEAPFQLEGATECKFTVTDDAATGGNLHLEVVYVEAEGSIDTLTP